MSKRTHAHGSGRNTGLRVIALFKLVKAALLFSVAVGVLTLLNKDVAALVAYWVSVVRIDPENRFIHGLLATLGQLTSRQLEEVSAGTFFYAALFLTEGAGLWFQKRWAEYFTVIATGMLVPLEIYELADQVRIWKMVALGINVVVVWYLLLQILRSRKKKKPPL
jgi:uncharacterized membrane protein (DUF2068 family)